MLFLTLCSSFGSLWGSIFAPFWHLWVTIWSTRGFPGQLCAHLLGCSEPQGPKCMQNVVSQPQRYHFRGPILALFCNFFEQKRVRGECWLAGRFFCSFSWSRDRLSLHPLQPAQSNHSFSCSVSPPKMCLFYILFSSILESFEHICSCFWCSFSELDFE